MSVVIDGLTIRYGSHVAVEDLSVTFPSGVLGLLGRNGAGKSSILRALLGLCVPAAGRMRFSDLPEGAGPAELRRHVGYMPERDAHLPACNGFEMVALLGRITGMRRRDAWRRAHEVLYLVGLEEQRYRAVSGYSAGMRQKVKLAAALVHDPKVLFLDEPTNGLDPSGRDEMLRLVRQLRRDFGKSIVLSTHILQDVEAVCDVAVVLERGRVVAQGSIAELTGGGARRWRIAVQPASLDLPRVLQEVAQVSASDDGVHEVQLAPGARAAEVFGAVRAAGGVVRLLAPLRRTLEDVFLQAVQTGRSDAAIATERAP